MSYANLINVRRPGILDTVEGLWPYSHVLTVSSTNPAAMFKTVQGAINYQETKLLSSTIILVDGGTYSEQIVFSLGNVCVTSFGLRGECIISSTLSITAYVNAPNVTFKNVTIDNAYNNAGAGSGYCVYIESNRDGTIFESVRFSMTNGSVDIATGVYIVGDADENGTLFRECYFNINAATTSDYGIRLANASILVRIEDCTIFATTSDVYLGGSGNIVIVKGTEVIGGGYFVANGGQLSSDEPLAGTITGPFTLADSLNGKNPDESIISSNQNTTDTTCTISGTRVLQDFKVSNIGAGGGGISHTALTNSQTGLVLDNCLIERITGSCTTSIAFSSTGGTTLAKNCIFNSAAGLTVNYAIYLVTAGSTVIIENGEVLAGTIITSHASAVLKLQGPRLASGVTLDNSGGGTIEGWYEDSDGNIWYSIGNNSFSPIKTPAVNLLYHSLHHDNWQEGTTFNDIADATTYIGMMWLGLQNGQSPDITGSAGGSTDNYKRALTCTFDSASSQAGFVQFLSNEDTVGLRGKTVSVSADLWGTNISNLAMNVIVWTSTADSPTKDVVATWNNGSAHALATNWAFGKTSTAIAITTTKTRYSNNNISVPTNANNIAVFISTWDNEASGDLFNIANVQLEVGPVATAFVTMDDKEERKKVLDWLYVLDNSTNAVNQGLLAKLAATIISVQLPIPYMRATPTLSHNITGYTGGAPGTTTIALVDVTTNGFFTITGALTVSLGAANKTFALITFAAGTSWSGTNGDLATLRIGPSVIMSLSNRF